MLTLALPPQAPPQSSGAEVRTAAFWEEAPTAQGPEGQQLQLIISEVAEHWSSQAGFTGGSVDDADLDYRPVPFHAAGTRRVRYHDAGALKPLTYVLDEDL